MSRTILIFGQSGAGKTTSCRNLDPETTFYIDADGKGLSWRGWRRQYNRDKQNYYATDILDAAQANSVVAILRAINKSERYAHIQTVVVDGISTLMIKEEFRRRKEKGYDKYQDMAAYIYETADIGNKLRDDLTVVFIGHVDVERDAMGTEVFAQLKTAGQKLKKIVLESLFTTVLYCKHDGNDFVFETVSVNSTAKSPLGALPAVVENDIDAVIKLLKAYEEEEE